ncbi:MAG: hypothetical protein HYX60_03505 [Legionella longbeachae]|nr:hypothetical protein [Legionella longbeachae]
MDSKKGYKPESKISIIFGVINSYHIHNTLENNGARNRESKAVFLIRDSSTYPGLVVISYYCQEQDMVKNLRLGLTENGWKMAPKPPQEPNMTVTAEVKAQYKHDKEKFDTDINNFLNTAKMLFEQEVTQEEIKSLCSELERNEFRLDGLIKPTREQASQEKHFIKYTSDTFISEEIFYSNKSGSNKCSDW